MPTKPQKTTKKTTKKVDPKEKVILGALELAHEQGWNNVTLRDIADVSGLSLAELQSHYIDKLDILSGLGRMIDQKVLANMSDIDPSASVRDTLFDILMDRFEVLNEHRDGILAILSSFKTDPKQALISSPHLCRSMVWMLESANVNTNGIRGMLQVAGLSALYLKVLKVWKKDESPDLAKTMAALDKELERGEQFANTLGF